MILFVALYILSVQPNLKPFPPFMEQHSATFWCFCGSPRPDLMPPHVKTPRSATVCEHDVSVMTELSRIENNPLNVTFGEKCVLFYALVRLGVIRGDYFVCYFGATLTRTAKERTSSGVWEEHFRRPVQNPFQIYDLPSTLHIDDKRWLDVSQCEPVFPCSSLKI